MARLEEVLLVFIKDFLSLSILLIFFISVGIHVEEELQNIIYETFDIILFYDNLMENLGLLETL